MQDGKKEKRDVKEGDVTYLAPDHSSQKNVGKGTVTTYTVSLKDPKPAAKK